MARTPNSIEVILAATPSPDLVRLRLLAEGLRLDRDVYVAARTMTAAAARAAEQMAELSAELDESARALNALLEAAEERAEEGHVL